MLKEFVYSLYLLLAFYIIVIISSASGLHIYPSTTFQVVGFAITFLTLFGQVNSVALDYK